MPRRTLVNRVGTSILPFMNPRVVCPPGTPAHNGRPNIVVATPMRSGTHLMIDLLLNNISEYKVKPLYIDLDQCYKQSGSQRDLVAGIESDAGQILKTHLPIGLDPAAESDPGLLRLIDTATVVTVRRDREAVMSSLARWSRTTEELCRHEHDYDAFWKFWTGRATLALEFEALFDGDAIASTLEHIATITGTRARGAARLPPQSRERKRIYINKGLTRLVGRHAPRIDTTIHTLKS